VRGGRLIATLLDLAKPDVVNDQELGASPGLEAPGVGAIGEAGVQIIEAPFFGRPSRSAATPDVVGS
jgi:hypothetical protein